MTSTSTKDPLEMMKKAFLIGIGATAITVEKIQELAAEMVERGELTQKDAVQFKEDLRERALKEKEQFDVKVKEVVDAQLKNLAKTAGMVTREEFDSLKAELEALKPHVE